MRKTEWLSVSYVREFLNIAVRWQCMKEHTYCHSKFPSYDILKAHVVAMIDCRSVSFVRNCLNTNAS